MDFFNKMIQAAVTRAAEEEAVLQVADTISEMDTLFELGEYQEPMPVPEYQLPPDLREPAVFFRKLGIWCPDYVYDNIASPHHNFRFDFVSSRLGELFYKDELIVDVEIPSHNFELASEGVITNMCYTFNGAIVHAHGTGSYICKGMRYRTADHLAVVFRVKTARGWFSWMVDGGSASPIESSGTGVFEIGKKGECTLVSHVPVETNFNYKRARWYEILPEYRSDCDVVIHVDGVDMLVRRMSLVTLMGKLVPGGTDFVSATGVLTVFVPNVQAPGMHDVDLDTPSVFATSKRYVDSNEMIAAVKKSPRTRALFYVQGGRELKTFRYEYTAKRGVGYFIDAQHNLNLMSLSMMNRAELKTSRTAVLGQLVKQHGVYSIAQFEDHCKEGRFFFKGQRLFEIAKAYEGHGVRFLAEGFASDVLVPLSPQFDGTMKPVARMAYVREGLVLVVKGPNPSTGFWVASVFGIQCAFYDTGDKQVYAVYSDYNVVKMFMLYAQRNFPFKSFALMRTATEERKLKEVKE